MIPLLLLAGFLGAGKTRFLTEIIPLLHQRGHRVRVILNDFENAEIDASRLGALDALVTPLNGECMCCGSLTELLDTLYAVPADPGCVMLIEANGATETDELLAYLTQETRLAQFTLPLQLTVIDAGRWQKRWWHNGLEAAQTRTATHVYLNWTERLSPQRLAHVEESLHKMNPRAVATTPVLLAETLAKLADSANNAAGRVVTLTAASTEPASRLHNHSQHVGSADAHVHPFASASMPLPAVVNRDAFKQFVNELPNEVVRAKGIVYFADSQKKMYVWSKVWGRRGVQLDECEATGVPKSSALFIGAQLPLDTIAALIETLRMKSAS